MRSAAIALFVLLAGCELVIADESDKDYRVDGGERFDAAGSCTTRCDGACVDLERSRDHCGECGMSCAAGEDCESGRCTPEIAECDAPLTPCGTECVDLDSSLAHCGACFAGCSHDCFDGMCEGEPCDAGEIGCDTAERCIDPLTDSAHCGGCDQACASDEVCVEGSCEPSPCDVTDVADTLCDGECVDIQSNALHCGGCGVTCEPGFRCAGGTCTCFYSTFCGGYCGTTFSRVHCGNLCGEECGPGSLCGYVATEPPSGECVAGLDDDVYRLWPDREWGVLVELTQDTYVCSDGLTDAIAQLACYGGGRVGRLVPASLGALGPPRGSPVDIDCPPDAVHVGHCTFTPSTSCSGRELLIFCEGG